MDIVANAAVPPEFRQLASSIAALAQSPLLQHSLRTLLAPISRMSQLASEGCPASGWSQASVTRASGTGRQSVRSNRLEASSMSGWLAATPRLQSRAEPRRRLRSDNRQEQPGPSSTSQNKEVSRNRSDNSDKDVFFPVSTARVYARHM